MNKKAYIKSFFAICVLAALVFVLLSYVSIPFLDTTLSVYAAAVSSFAFVFGPVVAFMGGFIGNLCVDLSAPWGIWWTWIVATGLYGLFVGIGCKDIRTKEKFGWKEFVHFFKVIVLSGIACWCVIAPVGDIIFYHEPAVKVFAQGVFIGLGAILSSLVIGSIVNRIYIAVKHR